MQLKYNDSVINQFKFNPLNESIMATAQEDSTVTIYDLNEKKVVKSYSTNHKGSIKGIAFSPSKQSLLCSVGLDKQFVLYDIN